MTKKLEVVPEMKEGKSFLQKLFDLQVAMGEFTWEKDGINRHQSYKYVTEAQYKTNFRKALQSAGLIWKMETISREFVPAISDKMHMVFCSFKGTITDPETGEREEYLFCGSGADNGDKALYKAVTGGHKFFLASNFNVAESNDPDADGETEAKVTYTSPEKREEIKQDLVDKDGEASKFQIKSLKKALEKLREADPDNSEQFIAAVSEKTEAFTKIKKTACETLIIKIGEMVEMVKGAAE